MKSLGLWISAAAIGVAVGFAGSAWSQTTESDSTVTTVPAASSDTVTKTTVVNPPMVMVSPPSRVTTTSESNTPDGSAASVQEKSRSKTTYGPLGVTHSESHEKSSSD